MRAVLYVNNRFERVEEFKRLAFEQGASSLDVRNPDCFNENSFDYDFDIAFFAIPNQRVQTALVEKGVKCQFLSRVPKADLTDVQAKRKPKSKAK